MAYTNTLGGYIDVSAACGHQPQISIYIPGVHVIDKQKEGLNYKVEVMSCFFSPKNGKHFVHILFNQSINQFYLYSAFQQKSENNI